MSDRVKRGVRAGRRNAGAFEALAGRVLMSGTAVTSIQLHWKDNSTTATGDDAPRWTNGVPFDVIAPV